MNRPLAIVVALVLASSCSTPSSVGPLAVPLQYKTMASPAEFTALPACATLSKIEVSDPRANKELGKRFVEGKNSPAASVTASSDITEWIRTGLESGLHRSNLSAPSPNAPELYVSVDQITTS